MQILFIVGMLLAGMLLLVVGGRLLVGCAVYLGRATGIPPFLIGATVVSFATTLPELLVSVVAAAAGSTGIAVGNAVGSVTVNTALVLGLSAAVAPMALPRRRFGVKSLLLLLACGVLAVAGTQGYLGMMPALLLLAIFAAFTVENLRQAQTDAPAEALLPPGLVPPAAPQTGPEGAISGDDARDNTPEGPSAPIQAAPQPLPPAAGKGLFRVPGKPLLRQALRFALALFLILAGAQLMARYGAALAEAMGVADSVIGVTIIALGTSMPELVTTVTALLSRQPALSAGNVFGANILDLAVVLPMCVFVSGGALQMPRITAAVDLPVCFAACLLVAIPSYVSEGVRRWQGVLLLLLYAAYTVALLGGLVGA